ncbi:hypothetical protein LguiB_034729 [Lonicera macranthoides]
MSGHNSKYFSTTKKGEIPELKEELNSQYKDSQEPNLFIRDLAVRTMGCIRTAAICVAKLYDINTKLVEDRGFLEALRDLISDNNAMVVANAVAALAYIQDNNGRPIFEIISHTLAKLLTALNECTEWGQIFILDALSKYKATDAHEAENIVERVTPRLQHANYAVVLSAIKVLLEFKEYATEADVEVVRKVVRAIGCCAIKVRKSIRALLESFLETFPEEPAQVQLQLLTFLKNLTEGPQQMIQVLVVLNNATVETDNLDLQDRACVYWRLLSTDPEAAKDIVLAEKPVITDDSNLLDSSLFDELLANIVTLSSVYHKPPKAFITRVRTVQKTEEEDDALPPPTSTRQVVATPVAPAAMPDLLDLMGLDGNNAFVTVDQPAETAGPPLPVLLLVGTGQGLQISAQLIRKGSQIYYSLLFENNTAVPLDGFMIQFNKNTFGLGAAGPLQVAVKNNQQPIWDFNDKVPLPVFFTEDGRMERTSFLEAMSSLFLDNSDQKFNGKACVTTGFSPKMASPSSAIGVPGLKCAIKIPSPEMAPLFFESLEVILET